MQKIVRNMLISLSVFIIFTAIYLGCLMDAQNLDVSLAGIVITISITLSAGYLCCLKLIMVWEKQLYTLVTVAPLYFLIFGVWTFLLVPNNFYMGALKDVSYGEVLDFTIQLTGFTLGAFWILSLLAQFILILATVSGNFLVGLTMMGSIALMTYNVIRHCLSLQASEGALLNTFPHNTWILIGLYVENLIIGSVGAYLAHHLLVRTQDKFTRREFVHFVRVIATVCGAIFIVLSVFSPILETNEEDFPLEETKIIFDRSVLEVLICLILEGALLMILVMEGVWRAYKAGWRAEGEVEDDDLEVLNVGLLADGSQVNNSNIVNNAVLVNQAGGNGNVRQSVRASMDENKEFNFETECCICLIQYELGNRLIRLKCGHIAHKECIVELRKRDTRCPLCRTQVFNQRAV